MSDYDTPDLDEITTLAGGLKDKNPPIQNVKEAFDNIRGIGDHLAAFDGGLIPGFRYTKVEIDGGNRAKNHFQGIQRLRRGKYVVISGADVTSSVSHLFVLRMASRPASGPWTTNVLHRSEPPGGDAIARVFAIEKGRYHGGGMQVLGDILALPLEGNATSVVSFLHMADPENPTRFPKHVDIKRTSPKAGAVALEKVRDRYVCAVWYEVDSAKPKGRIDFYVSKSADFFDGFKQEPAAEWKYGELVNNDGRGPEFQTINFIVDGQGEEVSSGRYRLFLVGTGNATTLAPLFGGKDLADLFSIELTDEFLDGVRDAPAPVIKLEREPKHFRLRHPWGNFRAGAGVHIDPAGVLNMYAVHHWRVDDLVQMTEFRAQPDPRPATIDDIKQAWVDLFEDDTYEGRRLSVLGKKDSVLKDYAALFVQGAGFNNKISSVQYQIPKGFKYRLYKDPRCPDGGVAGKDFVDLVGNGKLKQDPDFKRGPKKFGDRISSSQYMRKVGDGWEPI